MRNESADSVQSVLEFPLFMHRFSEAAGLTRSPLQRLEPTGEISSRLEPLKMNRPARRLEFVLAQGNPVGK